MTLQKLYADIGEDYAQALRVLRVEKLNRNGGTVFFVSLFLKPT